MSTLLYVLTRHWRVRRASRSTSDWSIIVKPNAVEREVPSHLHQSVQSISIHPGQLYSERYKAIRELGRGRYSSVWLVDDLRGRTLAAMKVVTAELSQAKGWDELGVLEILRARNPQSPGYLHIPHIRDHFTHVGHHGTHTCLIMEAMGPSAIDIHSSFHETYGRVLGLPLFLVKRMCKDVLLALQYAHECELVHTDIKGDNILMTGTPDMNGEGTRLTVEDLLNTVFKLTDFGAATKMSDRTAPVIQPVALRAPEVIVGAEWNTKADIWNFGCLMYEFMAGQCLFIPHHDNAKTGMNPTQTHLSQMVTLFGPFPQHLLRDAKHASRYFDSDGQLLHGAGQWSVKLRDLFDKADVDTTELPVAVDFLSRALAIDPAQRWSAAQLLEHPLLQDVE